MHQKQFGIRTNCKTSQKNIGAVFSFYKTINDLNDEEEKRIMWSKIRKFINCYSTFSLAENEENVSEENVSEENN